MPIEIGTIDAVFDWWDRIDDTITHALLSMGERLTEESALADIYPAIDMYGCGAFGCAYPTNTPHKRWVVKISLDPFEGPLTNLVIQDPVLQHHPGVAYIPHMWQLPVTHPIKINLETLEYKIWVILREEIDIVSSTPDDLDYLLHMTRLDAEAVNLTVDDIERGEAEDRDLVPYLDDFLTKLDKIDNYEIGAALANFMALYWEQTSVALADIHALNTGRRVHDLSDFGGHEHPEGVQGDYLVAFDIGASKVAPGKAPIELMRNPRRIPVI